MGVKMYCETCTNRRFRRSHRQFGNQLARGLKSSSALALPLLFLLAPACAQSISLNFGPGAVAPISVFGDPGFFYIDVTDATITNTNGNGIYAGWHGGVVIDAYSGSISAPNGTGIYVDDATYADVYVGSGETITAKQGIYVGYTLHHTNIVSYGTIIASGGPVFKVLGGMGNVSVVFKAGSRTVGRISGAFYAEPGADMSGVTLLSYGNDTVFLGGWGTDTFDIGTIGSGMKTIRKDDSSTWAITNSGNASNLAFIVNGGTLNISADNDLGTGSTLALKNGTTLGFTATGPFSHAVTVEGDPTFDTMGNTITYSGLISDGAVPGDLEVTGGGTLILTNIANSYSGGTVVKDGSTLVIEHDHELGTGGLTLGDATTSGTLRFVASPNFSHSVTLGAGGGIISIDGLVVGIAQGISGDGNLTKQGSGRLILTGAGTYTGVTYLNAGTLQIGDRHTTGSVSGNIVDNAKLTFNRADSYTYGGIVSGSGSLSQTGRGTLILTNTNTYTGGTTIAAGALQLGDAGTSGMIQGDVVDNSAFIFNRSDDITFAGNISGTGSVQFNGAGRVVLTGHNTYTGGIGVGSGATLRISDAGSFTGPIIDNGTINFDSSSQTFANAISGSGGVTFTGSGTLILTGYNTYTGMTTISSGTLQLGNGGTSGALAGPLTNNGSLLFDHSNLYTFEGTISGSGTVVQNGTGTLILFGANTYTGNTIINAGLLRISSDNNLGNGGTLVLGNGTGVILTGSGPFTHPVTVAGDPTFTVASGTTATWSGLISDGGTPGDVEVTGGGTLVLTNAANSYSGGTVVKGGSMLRIAADHAIGVPTGGLTLGDATSSGALQLGAGFNLAATRILNIATGGGTIDTNGFDTTVAQLITGSGGLTKAGAGTLTLNAAIAHSGTVAVSGGRLAIGDATHTDAGIAGATVASGGTLSGFGTVTGSVVNNGTILTSAAAGSLRVGGLMQSATGTLSVEISSAGASRLAADVANLGGTLNATFTSSGTAPQVYTVLAANGIMGTFANFTKTGAPSGMVYGVSYTPHEVGIIAAPETVGQIYGDLRIAMLDTAFALNGIVMDRLASQDCPSCSAWSVWARGLLSTAHTDGEGGASAFDNDLAGVIGGIDYRFDNGMSAHAAVAYGQSDLKLSGHAEKISTSTFYMSLAGHAPLAGFELDASAFFLQNGADLTRDTQYSGIAASKPDSTIFGFALQAGLPLFDGELIPTARLRYAAHNQSAVSETGGGVMGLAVASADTSELRGDIGVRLRRRFATGGGIVLVPELKLFLDQTLTSEPDRVALRFAAAADGFQSPSAKADRSAALIGASLKGELGGGWALNAAVDSRIGAKQTEVMGSFGVSWHF